LGQLDLKKQDNWKLAIKKKFNNMMKRNVWKNKNKKDIPQERKPMGSKWVFKKKKKGVYHARLVALGYSQVPGVDFTENYAPVINDIKMHTMIVLIWIYKARKEKLLTSKQCFYLENLMKKLTWQYQVT
jgi:Reverse transcriptase (RNA-dependent DNA polymerase)